MAASVLSFGSSIALLTLSYMEHSRSLRPSMLLNAYLFATVILDAATLRTLWLMPHFSDRIRNIFTVAFAIKAVVLLLEARGKSAYYSAERNMSPEDFSGIYGQALLSWLNRLIWQGARHLLKPEDLYAVSDDVASETLSLRFSQEWEKREYSIRLVVDQYAHNSIRIEKRTPELEKGSLFLAQVADTCAYHS